MKDKKHLIKSISDLRTLLEINEVEGSDEAIKTVIVNTKYVARKGIEEPYICTDAIVKKSVKLPKIVDDSRNDIIKFYDRHLTRAVNRKLANTATVMTVAGTDVEQSPFSIEKYSEDLTSLERFRSTYKSVEKVLSEFETMYMLDDDDLEKVIMGSLKTESKKYIPLLFTEEFNAILIDKPAFVNVRLDSGEPLSVGVPSLLGLPNSFKLTNETIAIDSNTDNIYLLDETYNNNLSIRKVNESELFGTYV